MTDFVCGHDDAGKSARVFNDGHAVDFLETLVYHARSAYVRESCIYMKGKEESVSKQNICKILLFRLIHTVNCQNRFSLGVSFVLLYYYYCYSPVAYLQTFLPCDELDDSINMFAL